MSEAQLKRKRSQREKAVPLALTKRQKSDHGDDQVQKIEKPSKTEDGANSEAEDEKSSKRKTRRSRRVRGDRIAVQDAQATDQLVVPGKALWSLSTPVGGSLLQHDPVFAHDESCVFAAKQRQVDVLSVATSLVERSLPASKGSVSAFALSPADGEELYVASADLLQRWNWITGTRVNDAVQLPGQILALSVTASEVDDDDICYTVCDVAGDYQILAGDRPIYTSKEALHHLQAHGQYILAATSAMLVVGKRSVAKSDSADKVHYDFVQIDITPGLTCLDARVQATESKKNSKNDVLSVALGNASGVIYLYDNVFPSGKPADQSLTPRTLHWHRDAVASLKWSRDANYLISGGRETVLVLWQLATGKKQFLPHLTAEIERLTVSPSGSSYAIQLADNSVMLLSTTELKPTANFAGLQAQAQAQPTAVVNDYERRLAPSAAALNPLSPDQLLLTVPPSSSEAAQSASTAPRPFLQTYDIASDRHISRQALTRNNATDFNQGPEGNKIRVPDVAFLQVSNDGKWLATAEEWSPPSPDVEHLAADKHAVDEQRLFRREVYLKIWRWDQARSVWVLESRIDSPHQLDGDSQPGRVLNLVADPANVGFATVGEDSSVRIWKPKTRLRNGIVVHGTQADGLVDWSCRHTISLDRSVELAEVPFQPALLPPPKAAALAYSEDGSMLAVSQAFEHAMATPVVHFINTAEGVAEQTRSGLFTGTIKALGFLDRHLIILADQSFAVWDIVDETQLYCINLERSSGSGISLLSVNHDDQTFAVSTPVKSVSRVQICTPTSANPQFSQILQHPVSALLAVRGRRGFRVLTSAAEVHALSPKTGGPVLSGVRKTRRAGGKRHGMAISTPNTIPVAETEVDDEMVDSADMLLIENDEADKPVVRPEQLARVFDRDNVALMPIREMFSAVVGLYARKPRVQASA